MNTKQIALDNQILLAEVDSLLSSGHKVVLMTKGYSMLPFIRGQVDSVRLVNKPFVEGDAVLAKVSTGNWVLHRVAKILEDTVYLHGDGNLTGHETCRPQDVRGVVEAIIGQNGKERPATSYRAAARWNALPYICRRVVLAFFRRYQNLLLKLKK